MPNNTILIISLLISLFNQIFSYIVYPLKTLNDNEKAFESLLSFNSTYTVLEMGTPPKEVNFYFSLNHLQINITDEGCNNQNLYNRNNSSSFKIAFELDESDQDIKTKYLVLDSIYFYNTLNLTQKLKIDEYPLFYSSDISSTDKDLCGNIGIAITQNEYITDSSKIKNYTDKLKDLGAGKYEDYSFFHYNNQDFLVYNIFLQSQFPELFEGIDKVRWLYPVYRRKNYELLWEISMKEIYYNDIHSKINIYFEFNPLFDLILGTNDFKENITRDYFNSYINKGICFLKEYNGFNYFECNSEKFTSNDIKNFPTIYMPNLGLNHIFELKSEELFIKVNNNWYFQIVFLVKDLEYERWIMGKIFLRKYPVKFSPFNRLIGFYIKPNNEEINQDDKEQKGNNSISNNNSKIYIYIIIIIVALAFTGLGLFLGQKFFYPRKKRANELLDDNYQYDSEYNKENRDSKGEIISENPIN